MDRLERLLRDPDFHRKNRRILTFGIVLIVIGTMIPIYAYIHTIPNIETYYQSKTDTVAKWTADTEAEMSMLDICKSLISAAREGWVTAASKTAYAATVFMWLSGGNVLGVYLLRRKFRRIIEQYPPNQAL